MFKDNVNGFDWDKGNLDKCQKHGVLIREIESLFDNELAVFPDIVHSNSENRFIAIGKTEKGRQFLWFSLYVISGIIH